MTIGGSIVLIVIGAILAFAVEYDLPGLSIDVMGIILMVAGVIGLIVGLILSQRSRTTSRVVDERDVY
jgi:hypothetical protein